MNKYVLILFFSFLVIPVALTQTIQHRAKTPSFFVPKDAFENKANSQQVIVKPLTKSAKKQVIIGKPQVAVKTGTQLQIAPKKVQNKITVQAPVRNNNPNPQTAKAENSEMASTAPQITDISPVSSETYTNPFQLILSEYLQDTALLAQGQTANNPRLQNVLADFKNSEHKL